MSLLVDPALCPDCRGRVGPDAACAGCGLRLTGPVAAELWRTMVAADALVTRLRDAAAPAPSPAPSPGPAPAPGVGVGLPSYPSYPSGPVAVPARGSSLGVVPMVLLGLGGFFVLVAASLFLAVTWAILPLALKALAMLGVTVALAAGAAHLCRGGLRVAAEVLWAVVAGVLALDVGAGWRSGLLGLDVVPGRVVALACGVLMVGLGAGVAAWVGRTPVARCVAAEATLVVGVLLVSADGFWSGPGSGLVAPSVGVALLVVGAAALRDRMPEAAYAVLGLAAVTWLLLVGHGVDDALGAASRGDYWSGLGSGQLLVAGAYAALVALPRRVPATVRTGAATACLGCLACFVLLPFEAGALQWLLLAAVVAALAGLAAIAPPTCARAAALLGWTALAGTALATLVVPVLLTSTLLEQQPLWTSPLDVGARTGGDDAWTLLPLLAASAAVVAGSRPLLAAHRRAVTAVVIAALPAAVGLAGGAALLGSAAPLWSVVGTWALVGGAATVAGVLRRSPRVRVAAGAPGALAVLLALLVASRSDLLTGVAATALAGTALVMPWAQQRPTRPDPVEVVLAVVAVSSAAWAVLGWAHAAGAPGGTVAVLLAATGATATVGAAYAVRGPGPRLAAELTGVLPALAALAPATDPSTVPVVLTLLGAGLALLCVLHSDRTAAGWAASAVLALATFVRAAQGTTAPPETYALPVALVLVAAGLWRLRRAPARPTRELLGPGLGLALGPSLVLTMADPASLRGLLVGVGAATALAVGVRCRWRAPFTVGAVVLVVLGLRFLGPLATSALNSVFGPWLAFGVAGAVLLAAGIAWEQALGRARLASRYVTGLR